MVGMHGTVEANRALANTDLIIALGMRFDDRVTGNVETFGVGAKVIHVEIDPSEIDKTIKTDVALNADTAQVLTLLAKEPMLITKTRRLWIEQINKYRTEIADEVQKEIEIGVGQEGRLLMKSIVKTLSDVTHGKDLIVSDVGQHQMILARFYNYQTTNSWFASGGAGTMGCSLPMAIGVKMARPDERVWSVSGDGGFQMNIQELGTIMEHDIDVKIILLNNGYLGMVRQWQTMFFDGRYAGTPMQNPNFGDIASAYGIPYQRISELDKIESAIEAAAAHKGAYMLEFLCDPTEIVLPMVPAGGSVSDMIVSLKEIS